MSAAQRLRNAKAPLPRKDRLELLFGNTLLRAGRTREAAVRFAAAHLSKTAGNATKAEVSERMSELAEVWDLDASARSDAEMARQRAAAAKKQGGDEPNVEIISANADGSTTKEDMGKLSPELLEQIKKMAAGGGA